MRTWALVLTIALCAGAAFFLMRSPNRGAYDFQAFYCAGTALREHADPYRTQPLGACEHRQTAGTYAALASAVVVPAPLPGYDLAGFAVLSRLSFADAKAAWGALLTVAIALTVVTLLYVTGASADRVFCALAAALVLPSLGFGEPFALFALAASAAAYFLQRKQWAWAAVAAALSLVEPNLGLPICVALALWKRETRTYLAASIAALAAVSLLALGWTTNVEYLTAVLPLHALSDLTSDAQLGMATVLHALGVADGQALLGGTISYVVAAAIGAYAARGLAERLGSDAYLVFVPAAFAVIGGSYVHVTQMFAAIPLALMLRSRAALVLLAIPWQEAIEASSGVTFAVLAALVTFYLVWERADRRILAASTCAFVAFVALSMLHAWYGYVSAHAHHNVHVTIDLRYPQAAWQAWTQATISTGSLPAWILRLPTWAGLAIVVALAARVRAGKEPLGTEPV